MIDTLYNGMFTVAMCILAMIAFAYLIRAVIGPKFSDRILTPYH